MFSINFIQALSVSFAAGLCTGIGSIIAYLFGKKVTNGRFLSSSLAFSAGVMIYVSLFEILNKSYIAYCNEYTEKISMIFVTVSFFAAMLAVMAIEAFVPEADIGNDGLVKTGLFAAFAIALHNLPEGFATFFSALEDPGTTYSVAAAIAIHNIPEGIAVFVPVYCGGKSAKKAFAYSLLSGLTEPIGALIGYILLMALPGSVSQSAIQGTVFAVASGIMIFLSFNELLPQAFKYNDKRTKLLIFSGMCIMAISLCLFK